jgi:hypothetical protein
LGRAAAFQEVSMLYVMLLSWRENLSNEQMDEALIKRSRWQYPEGLKLHGEYWPATSSPAVISVFEASNYEPIMEMSFTWRSYFDITVIPATTPEEGLNMGKRVMERLAK